MAQDIYNTNAAQQSNWAKDYVMPIITTAAGIGYNMWQQHKQNQFNAQQAELNRQFNAEEAQKARDYETEMSNTAVTRAMEDYKNAGMNPHLATGGGPASTPAGSAASGSAATSAGMMPMDFASNLNTALMQSQIENMHADTDLKYKNAGKSEKEVETMEINNRINKAVSEAEIALKAAQTKEQKATARNQLAQAIGQEYINAYTQKNGYPPNAKATDKFMGDIHNLIEKIGEDGTAGPKLATFIFGMI